MGMVFNSQSTQCLPLLGHHLGIVTNFGGLHTMTTCLGLPETERFPGCRAFSAITWTVYFSSFKTQEPGLCGSVGWSVFL